MTCPKDTDEGIPDLPPIPPEVWQAMDRAAVGGDYTVVQIYQRTPPRTELYWDVSPSGDFRSFDTSFYGRGLLHVIRAILASERRLVRLGRWTAPGAQVWRPAGTIPKELVEYTLLQGCPDCRQGPDQLAAGGHDICGTWALCATCDGTGVL